MNTVSENELKNLLKKYMDSLARSEQSESLTES